MQSGAVQLRGLVPSSISLGPPLRLPSHPGTMIQASPATSFKASTDKASGHVWGALVTDATFSVQAQADGRGGTTGALWMLRWETHPTKSLFLHSPWSK